MKHVVQDGKNKPCMPQTITKMDTVFAKCSKIDPGFVFFSEKTCSQPARRATRHPYLATFQLSTTCCTV
jgi:hypothetical protein